MAAPLTVRRINRSDFKGADPNLIRLISVLNSVIDTLYTLSTSITFRENVASDEHERTFTTAADYVAEGSFEPIVFKLRRTDRARCVQVCQLRLVADNDPVQTGAVSLDWIQVQDEIRVRHIAGLADSTRYFVRLRAD